MNNTFCSRLIVRAFFLARCSPPGCARSLYTSSLSVAWHPDPDHFSQDKNVRDIVMELLFPFTDHGAVDFMLRAQFGNRLNFLERLQCYARLELFRILNSLLHSSLLVEGFIIPHFYTLTSGLNLGIYYRCHKVEVATLRPRLRPGAVIHPSGLDGGGGDAI